MVRHTVRPSEFDDEAARRVSTGLRRLQALIARDGESDELVVEDAEFSLRLSTTTTADGQREQRLLYSDVDGSFHSGVSLEPASSDEEGVASFLEGALFGDLAGNDSWSALAGQTVVGLIPIVGQVADGRDTLAAVEDVVEGEEGGWGHLVAAGLGWVPLAGDLLKGALRLGKRFGKEAVEEGAERLIREGAGEGGDAARRTEGAPPSKAARKGDELSDAGLNRPVPLTADELARITAWGPDRAAFLDRWSDFDGSAFRERTQALLWSAADNAVLDHLRPDDFAGAFKEMRGVKILDSDGKVLDHVGEVRDAVKSLRNTAKLLEKHIRWLGYRKDLVPGEVDTLQDKLSDIRALIDAISPVK